MDLEEKPVAAGLVALVAVAAVVGLLVGLIALAGSTIMGFSGGSAAVEATETADAGESLYLPDFEETDSADEPAITLGPGAGGEAPKGEGKGKKKSKAAAIKLSTSTESVAAMERIELSGSYPGGAGAILQVQRRDVEKGSEWEEFPVTISVDGEQFSSWVATGQSGVQFFRVVDNESKKASNFVRVEVG